MSTDERMGSSREKTPTEIGTQLAIRLRGLIEDIPRIISAVDRDDFPNLDDIDKEQLVRELIILTYVGQRLALQIIEFAETDKRKAICYALDSFAGEFLDSSQEFAELLDRRTKSYFQLLSSHLDTIERGDWNDFFEALAFEFEQFCRGGGGSEDNHIIGGFRSKVTLRTLAQEHWLEGFTKTIAYVT